MTYPVELRREERRKGLPARSRLAAPTRSQPRDRQAVQVSDIAPPALPLPAPVPDRTPAAPPAPRPTEQIRRELARGLRYTHFRANANTSELIQIAAAADTVKDVLREKGVLPAEEFEARRAAAAERISKQFSSRGMGVTVEGTDADKYAATGGPRIDCENRIALCGAACCKLRFALSRQDLDEGTVRWDVGNPYVIAQGADQYCVHLDREEHRCGIYEHRPLTCRTYDCRKDSRIWVDFEGRIINPAIHEPGWPLAAPAAPQQPVGGGAATAVPAPVGFLERALAALTSRPVLVRFGGYFLSAYGALLSLGWALGTFYWLFTLGRAGQVPPWFVAPLLVPAAWAGSKGLLALERRLARSLGQQNVAATGNTFYGGLAAVAAAFAAWRPEGFLAMADCAAPAIALGYACAKLGCLASGCCIGCLTRRRFALRYTAPESKAVGFHRLRGVPLAPVQLYESLFGLALFAMLTLAPSTWLGSGRVFGAFLAALAAGRGVLLPFRHRAPEDHAAPLVASLAHLALFGAGLVFLMASFAPLAPVRPAAAPGAAAGSAAISAAMALVLFGIHRRKA